MKKLTVDGITFETTKEAKAAERELEAIEKIRDRMDVTDPTYAKVLYEKLIEKEMLHTKVGEKFLTELLGYCGAEAAQKAEKVVEAEEETEAGAPAEQEEVTVIPYLDNTAQAEPSAAALEEYPPEEEAQEETAGDEAVQEETVPEETAPEDGLREEMPGTAEFLQEAGSVFDEQTAEQTADETDALDAFLFGKEFEVMSEGETEESVDAELDAFMHEYGLYDEDDADAGAANGGTAQPEEEDEALTQEELEAFMGEYGVTEVSAPEDVEEETQPEVENEEADAAELDALLKEYSEESAGAAEEPRFQPNIDEKEEPRFQLNVDEKEENAGREEIGFGLDPDEINPDGEEPDDDTLLAQARELQKELHQEDLSEVFSGHEESPEKKHFSLYGVLLVSVILNVILVFSMVIMVQVFKNSDNRNILNYERILEQEYQTGTPTDADASDLQ